MLSIDYYVYSKKTIDQVTNNIEVFIINPEELTTDRISIEKLKSLLGSGKRIVTMQVNENYNISIKTSPLLNEDTVLTIENMDQEVSKLIESPHEKPGQWKIIKSGMELIDTW